MGLCSEQDWVCVLAHPRVRAKRGTPAGHLPRLLRQQRRGTDGCAPESPRPHFLLGRLSCRRLELPKALAGAARTEGTAAGPSSAVPVAAGPQHVPQGRQAPREPCWASEGQLGGRSLYSTGFQKQLPRLHPKPIRQAFKTLDLSIK